ncbi:UDP-N-acetylmuramoylalanyl-D-glutamate--2,6-diaminopimelate ligase [Desulfurobacterium pacificum]|uniref:UDP-N-acetylmuramoyl-L-alanyl-D-glutamate--2,6-diaminopimelate ligase n=1 Tax=Desulfurobacterium pacificum TaxID=240166 RepID=A0ABY1NAJ3_9BACT|nr:UDP-N-acetylmuramoyl-L-alanyl-D-glutamate--2,6-diaminopimelate ligase [Desulfurobacterium pacificum]SMP04826.1 UDP-N-acetylmuramoylalanyl-D-glutamate--2,6-diaminopimelate ligase [Desulfurobacterium pacificum]
MKLGELLREVAQLPSELAWKEVKGITDNSKEVKANFLFFAIKGFKTDGNAYIEEAFNKGALAVVTDSQRAFKTYKNRNVILVKNARKLLSFAAAKFFGNPHKSLRLIGVTGTNGKTTTTFVLYHALNRLGTLTGIIGTVKKGIPQKETASVRTTPSSIEFFKTLKEIKEAGAENVVIEVSSHGLELYRTYPAEFDYSCFTNLSPEHLDFHVNMENYLTAKEKLLFRTKNTVLINTDDKYGSFLYGLKGIFSCKTLSYGKDGDFAFSFIQNRNGLTITINGETVRTNLKGEFNAYNVAAAYSILRCMGYRHEDLKNVFLDIYVPGRLEEVAPNVFVDYAHTPDALEKVLKALRELKPSKIITVFGCGGDRDREKRPLMGKVAERFSDKIVITSDNPRNEDPEKIIAEILEGIEEKEKVEIVPDRKEAILKALKVKEPNDVVLIAGKGHENYQIVGDKVIHFSDSEVVRGFYESV